MAEKGPDTFSQGVVMTLEPNDPRLTALLLGELTDAERAALEAKVAASEPLCGSVESVRQTVDLLRSELAAEPCPHLSPVQRELVLHEIATAGTANGAASAGGWVPLLGSMGWGVLGLGFALAATALLVLAGVIGWQLGANGPENETAVQVSTDTGQPQDAAGVVAVDESSSRGGAATEDLSVIVIRVGESLQLNVLGQLEAGREITLTPDRLNWSTQPLGEYVRFDPRTMTIEGRKVTPQPVVLTVCLDGMSAQVRVRVIPGDA